MSSIEKELDENEFILLNDENINRYNLDPNNLYSYEKKTDDELMIYESHKDKTNVHINLYKLLKSIIKGGEPKDIKYLTTYYKLPNKKEQIKMINFINKYSPLNVHIPFKFNKDIFYIEYTARKKTDKTEKLIISICSDREHKKELIHISCFPNSYIHLTFIINKKHYKIYQQFNPDKLNRFNDIFDFIFNCINLFEIIKKKELTIDWNNDEYNNWRNDIIKDDAITSLFYEYIMIFLECIRYLIERKFFIEKFF